MLPELRGLATYIPHGEHVLILIRNLFDVKPDGRNCVRELPFFVLDKERRLASIVKSKEEYLLILVDNAILASNSVCRVCKLVGHLAKIAPH